jgi:putative ABC transport system ATP-binding protein
MIQLQHIQRDFRVGEQSVHALNDINLDIDQGAYVAIMGPSGSGKSTLLNMLGLLDTPTSGRYLLDDRDVTQLDEEQQAQTRNRYIGFVFQAFHLVPRLSAEENIELPLMLAGMDKAQRRTLVAEALNEMGLEDRATHKPDQLSGGQRQRVAIARATVTRPRILLADEPTGNLDQKSGGDVIRTLESLNERGITLIVVTHDLDLGERAGRLIRMVDGRIVDSTDH